jgi:hypothetical protein
MVKVICLPCTPQPAHVINPKLTTVQPEATNSATTCQGGISRPHATEQNLSLWGLRLQVVCYWDGEPTLLRVD